MNEPEKIYQIVHYYETGGSPCLIKSNIDPTNEAVAIQLKAETDLADEIMPNCRTIAHALTTFFGYEQVEGCEPDVFIDMHSERSVRCGEWFRSEFDQYNEKIDDKSFYKFMYDTLDDEDLGFFALTPPGH